LVLPQTLAGILESFEENLKVGIREEPRITEQASAVSAWMEIL
jgi:hypothetical protein